MSVAGTARRLAGADTKRGLDAHLVLADFHGLRPARRAGWREDTTSRLQPFKIRNGTATPIADHILTSCSPGGWILLSCWRICCQRPERSIATRPNAAAGQFGAWQLGALEGHDLVNVQLATTTRIRWTDSLAW